MNRSGRAATSASTLDHATASRDGDTTGRPLNAQASTTSLRYAEGVRAVTHDS